MTDHRAQDVIDFWFGAGVERGKVHKRWFEKDAVFDAEIRGRFLGLWEEASRGALEHWASSGDYWLAYVVLCDQFPRNMFRGSPRAFETDGRALAAARNAVERRWDRALPEIERGFAWLPFEHSESLADQEKALGLYAGHPNHEWAVKHWEIIRRFGRFPHRNAALGRDSTPEEIAFLKEPGSSF